MSHLKRTVIIANMLLATDENLVCVRVCVLTSVNFSAILRVHVCEHVCTQAEHEHIHCSMITS